MKQKIQEIWKNKVLIIQGIWNYFFGSRKTKEVAKNRLQICQSNKCGFYDATGQSEKAFIKGEPACEVCGCHLSFLVASMESKCSLQELNQDPLW